LVLLFSVQLLYLEEVMKPSVKIFHCSENASEVFLMDFEGVLKEAELTYVDESSAQYNMPRHDKYLFIITDQFLKNKKCLDPILINLELLTAENSFVLIYHHHGLSRTDKIFDVKSQGKIDVYYYRNFWERRYINERRWIIDSDMSQNDEKMNYLNGIKNIKEHFDAISQKLSLLPSATLEELEKSNYKNLSQWLKDPEALDIGEKQTPNDLLSRVPSLKMEVDPDEADQEDSSSEPASQEEEKQNFEGDLLKKLIKFKKSQLGDSEIGEEYIKQQISQTQAELKSSQEEEEDKSQEQDLLEELAHRLKLKLGDEQQTHTPDEENEEEDHEIIVDDEDATNWAYEAASRRTRNPEEELKALLDLQEQEELANKRTMSDQNGEDRLYYEMALFKYRQGLYDEAKRYYEKSKALNPQLGNKRNENAFSHKGPLKYEEAISIQNPVPAVSVPKKGEVMTVLITGATSGIGRATAERFAKAGHHLILTGRRKKRLNRIKDQWENQYNIKIDTLKFDIRDMEETVDKLSQLRDRNIDILINNAGLASGLSEIHEGDIEDWERMIDTNIKGLLYATRSIAPQMVTRGRGHIINIGSIAGKQAYPKGNVYNASKFAVEGLTQAMRMDLHKYNIRVSQIAPGHVEETEFAKVRFHGDEDKAKIYGDFNPVTSSDIAEIIYFMAIQPDHVTIQDVLVAGTQQASATMIDRSGRKYD